MRVCNTPTICKICGIVERCNAIHFSRIKHKDHICNNCFNDLVLIRDVIFSECSFDPIDKTGYSIDIAEKQAIEYLRQNKFWWFKIKLSN